MLFRGSCTGAGEQPDGLYIGVITSGDVAFHHHGVTLRSGPVSAAARRLDGNPVSGGQHVAFALREMRRRRSYAALAHGNLVHGAGTAAEQARRSDPTVIHQERGFRLAAQQPDLIVDPEAVAMPPGAPRAFAQRKAVEQD